MLRRTGIAMVMWSAALLAQTPAEGEPPHFLDEARRVGLNYSKSLPDFICTEIVNRFEAHGATAPFRPSDVLTLQLSYFQMKENYKLVLRNNKPTKQSINTVGGAISQGEFGSKLLLTFHPQSKSEFTFQQWDTLADRRVAVYTYRVKRVNSHYEMRMADRSVIAGYHGEVFIDEATHMVLRVAESVDVPDGFPVQFSHNTEDYEFVDVSGRKYVLPVRCETMSGDMPAMRGRNGRLLDSDTQAAGQMRYRNVIEFRDYRKYAAESTLSFDTPAGPPK